VACASQLLRLAEVSALSYKSDVHKHLRRLERVWIDFPIYYITTCVRLRKTVLAQDAAARILVEEWQAARRRQGWAVGRYVIMPDHGSFLLQS
jgi:hypothetical protein